jgi:hypothetical protein
LKDLEDSQHFGVTLEQLEELRTTQSQTELLHIITFAGHTNMNILLWITTQHGLTLEHNINPEGTSVVNLWYCNASTPLDHTAQENNYMPLIGPTFHPHPSHRHAPSQFVSQQHFDTFVHDHISLVRGVIPVELSQRLLEDLCVEFTTNFQTNIEGGHGRQLGQRREILYADTNLYPDLTLTHSNGTLVAKPISPDLEFCGTLALNSCPKNVDGFAYNSVLVNFYESGEVSMPAHQDNEKDHTNYVIIINIGPDRRFFIQDSRSKCRFDSHEFLLTNGDGLYADPEANTRGYHGCRSAPLSFKPRLSLTYRFVKHPHESS